jgi:antitoxin ParD1/3/4
MHSISLPDPIHASAQALAEQAGFKSVEEYLADLVRRDLEHRQQEDPDFILRRALAENGDPKSVTDEEVQRRKQEIEALLIEGLNSGPAAPMTAEDWAEIRREVRERRERRERRGNA